MGRAACVNAAETVIKTVWTAMGISFRLNTSLALPPRSLCFGTEKETSE